MARRTAKTKGSPAVVPAWEVSGTFLWYHYTNKDAALQIDKEHLYVVSRRGHQQHGTGMFVTTIAPKEMTAEALLTRLFAKQRSPDNVQAVVVLMLDKDELPVRPAGPRSYIHSAAPGTEIDLSLIYVGYGYREPNKEGWMFSGGIYMPKI